MADKQRRGLFIVFEGGDGAGKTTQIEKVRQWLTEKGKTVRVTREAGGTPIGDQIRTILLDPKNSGMIARTELLLYEASRAQHVDEFIVPALERGEVVLCDRFFDSSTVYQGLCRGLGKAKVEALNRFATNGLRPDFVIVLDVPPETRKQRMESRGSLDRLEQEDDTFHEKVRKGFLTLAKSAASRMRVISSQGAPEEVFARIRSWIDKEGTRKRLWKS